MDVVRITKTVGQGCPGRDSTAVEVRGQAVHFVLRLISCLCLFTPLAPGPAILNAGESDYYHLITYPLPDDLKLEVSGLALLPDGRLAAAIRKGEIWIIENAEGPSPDQVRFRQFASGLHEPLGLAWRDGALYTVQRTELTRLRDIDGDDRADEYLTVAKGWGVSGAYHEYAYGPVFDRDGNAWITLNISMGTKINGDDAWRGWSLKVRPDGSWVPVSGGFRSPCGIGLNAAGDVFVTDQQGNWFGTNPLIHVRAGIFHGHVDALKSCVLPGATFKKPGSVPQNLTVVEAARRIPPYELPAVWFPYRKMGMSTTDILCDTTRGKFGPFENQLFVGEFTMSAISRVYLEKVGGEYQGACFPFRKGFQCAVLRLAWGNDGSMFVGESNRGWNSLGTRSYGLQRLIWTGKTPFEVREMRAQPDGFELTFTLPVDPKSAADSAAYRMTSYTYEYHSSYGSDEIDSKELTVARAAVSADGLLVRLTVEGLRRGYVHELHLEGVRSGDDRPLLHSAAYYTLNRIPAAGRLQPGR